MVQTESMLVEASPARRRELFKGGLDGRASGLPDVQEVNRAARPLRLLPFHVAFPCSAAACRAARLKTPHRPPQASSEGMYEEASVLAVQEYAHRYGLRVPF